MEDLAMLFDTGNRVAIWSVVLLAVVMLAMQISGARHLFGTEYGAKYRIAVWSGVLLSVVALGWLLVQEVRQLGLALQIYEDEQFPAPAITRRHIEALRKMRFAWDSRIESGGPVVDPFTPYGSTSMAADLAPIIGAGDREAVARFHREVSEVLIWALDNCTVEPGQYRLAHLTNSSMEHRRRQDLEGLPAARIEAIIAELPRLEPDGYFRFTDQHRRLLQHLRFEWPAPDFVLVAARGIWGYPVPAVHFKRPFGDMTAFEYDMADILERPRPGPGERDSLLERLYLEMWPALQTFVEYVTITMSRPSDSTNGRCSVPSQLARGA
jgi:hypothetical protein